MSKHINVNPDHYKVAGRERQGEEVVHQATPVIETRGRKKPGDANFIPGAAAVGISGKDANEAKGKNRGK